ncbi:O-antigen ligase family protein, partial [Pantanalinema rosaneae CENA516]|uniref:O-antigen ligase family protein n=1 Tax=Pantanalinema rosaneae TaxID=1620701 RepID=UPI003D6FD855
MQDSKSIAPPALRGNLLGLLTAAFYILFTLLPDSNSLMLSWPWVFLWQVGLICPVLWLLGMLWQRQLRWLGHRLDWLVGILIVGLVVSAGLATFPRQAQWHSWTVFCTLATLYAVSSWLSTRDRRVWLLTMQGYLNLAFIAISLLLWTGQTLLPELSRLQEFQRFGISLPFDFSNIELRNWAPIGHQNYVAGYLTLALPLLVALGMIHRGRQRWLWGTGIGLGLIALYTTSSRSGWLAIAVLAVITSALMLWRSTLPKRWLGMISVVGVVGLGLIILSNNRLRSLLSGQSGGESAFRIITMTTGWQMGWSDPLSGIGLGGVPLLYQKFRPGWAGREAELVYQLHSTPAQLWAELGIWSVLVGVGAIAVLSYLGIGWWQWRQRESRVRGRSLVEEIGSGEDEGDEEAGEEGEVANLSQLLTGDLSSDHGLIGAIYAGFLAYGIVSLTDYQLDNLAISGTLMIYLAVLTSEFRSPPSPLSPSSCLLYTSP